MRRVVKALARGEEDIGDISTLANAEAVEAIRKSLK